MWRRQKFTATAQDVKSGAGPMASGLCPQKLLLILPAFRPADFKHKTHHARTNTIMFTQANSTPPLYLRLYFAARPILAVPVVRDRVLGRRNFTLMERMFRQSNEATPLAMQAAPLNGVSVPGCWGE